MLRFFCLLGIVLGGVSTLAGEIVKDRTGFTFGVSMGAFKASNKNALYYNGAPDKENSIDALLSDPYTREALFVQLKEGFKVTEYSTLMDYKTTISIMGMLGYRIKNNLTLFSQLQYVKLSTGGYFVVELESPKFGSIESGYQTVNGEITAQEARLGIDLGLHYSFDEEGQFVPFVECTGGFVFTEVKSHDMSVGGFKRSMTNITYENLYSDNTKRATGYGVSATFGLEGPLKTNVFYNLGATLSMQKINLYKTIGLVPHGCLFVRFVM